MYEVNYKLLLAVQQRKLVTSTEHRNLSNEGTHGKRQNRMATTLPLIEKLMMEKSRYLRINTIKFDNNATSGYNWRMAGIGSLLSQAYWMNQSVAVVWVKTLEEAEYKLKTWFTLSETG